MRAATVGLVLLGVACRAAPIPDASRYPSGTGLTPRYVVVDGTRIRYVEAGSGPPVVLIHGLGGSIYSWRGVIGPVAAAGFHVVAFDNRGFGGSDKPGTGYHSAELATLAVHFLDSLHLSDVVLVGHSMGGEIAALAALRAPDRVRGLVLVDAAGFGTHLPLLARIARAPLLGRMLAGLRGRSGVAAALRSAYADPRRITGADIDQYYAPVAEPDFGRALAGVARQFDFTALAGRLDSIRIPTLVVWGADDRWIPVTIGQGMALRLPRVAFVLVPDAGHDVPDEAPAALDRSLIAFLEQGLPAPPANVAMM